MKEILCRYKTVFYSRGVWFDKELIGTQISNVIEVVSYKPISLQPSSTVRTFSYISHPTVARYSQRATLILLQSKPYINKFMALPPW
jgi:hypothetical protein